MFTWVPWWAARVLFPYFHQPFQEEAGLFDLLPDDVLDTCFSFLGPGHFFFVATTCKRFHNVYFKESVRKKHTSYENVAWSVSCASMILEEASGNDKQVSLERIAAMAGKQGRLDVVKWIYNHKKYDCHPCMFLEPAARWGRLNILEWAESTTGLSFQGDVTKTRDNVAQAAARNGRVDVLEFLHSHGIDFSSGKVYDSACFWGHVAVLDWMKARNYTFFLLFEMECCCNVAAILGHVNVLDWLSDNGLEVNWNTSSAVRMAEICRAGHLQVLLWAWRHGAPELDEFQCSFIQEDHYLILLQGLFEAECPWARKMLDYARSRGYQRVVDWAVENGWAG